MKVLICGSLCNLDLAFGELLSRYKLDVTVVRGSFDPEFNLDVLPDKVKYLPSNNLVLSSGPNEFLTLIKKSDLVISITGSAIMHFGKYWPLAPWLIRKPIVSIGTGSDFSELLVKTNLLGRVYRALLRRSSLLISHPYAHIVKNIARFGFTPKTLYTRYPYFLHPRGEQKILGRELKILHVTNFDWGETDNAPGRNSYKNNQIFIKGILDSMSKGFEGLCTLSFRGPDRELARKWIDASDYAKQFSWVKQISSRELKSLVLYSDIIVDQFAVGGFGMIAYEGMSLGVPVILSLDKQYLNILYPEDVEIPAFNLKTSQEISDFFLTTKRMEMHNKGIESENWVRKNHDVHLADFSELVQVISEVAIK